MKTIVVVTEADHLSRVVCDVVRSVLTEMRSDPAVVSPACSVNDVIKIMARRHIDVLMVNDSLAEATGLELIQWLGASLADTAKILLTKDSRLLAAPESATAVGVDAVLARPVGKDALKRALQQI